MANSLKTSCLPQLQSNLLAVYLVGLQHFFLALWTLVVAAHSLDKEHHLGLSSKSVSCSDFDWGAQEMTLPCLGAVRMLPWPHPSALQLQQSENHHLGLPAGFPLQKLKLILPII